MRLLFPALGTFFSFPHCFSVFFYDISFSAYFFSPFLLFSFFPPPSFLSLYFFPWAFLLLFFTMIFHDDFFPSNCLFTLPLPFLTFSLLTFDLKADAFWCLDLLLQRIPDRFAEEGPCLHENIDTCRHLLRHVCPKTYATLTAKDAIHIHFAYHWLLLDFRREFSLDQVGLSSCMCAGFSGLGQALYKTKWCVCVSMN